MESGGRRASRRRAGPDSLVRALIHSSVLAPGGFVAGHLVGRAVGAWLIGCPLAGQCNSVVPALFALPCALIGMGCGAMLAATRVSRWWEGILVLAAGIAAMLVLVVLIGWLGRDGWISRALALLWLIAAIGLGLLMWLPAESENQKVKR